MESEGTASSSAATEEIKLVQQNEPTKLLNGAEADRSPAADGLPGAADSRSTRKVYYFGCGPCHPSWLQFLANGKMYSFMLSLFVTVEGALISGVLATVLSSVERRYHFSSTAAGFISSTFEITIVLMVVFVSYFGGRGHTPKWLGMGCVIQGIGALIFISPQFIFFNNVSPEAAENKFQLCSTNVTEVECDVSNAWAYAILLLGYVFIGLGATPLFSIGLSYLDTVVHPKYISLHLAVIYTVQVFGPAIGFGVGGAVLSVYVDPWVSTDLTETDPNYVGAWWISYLVLGIISLLISIPFFMYPLRLKDYEEVEKARIEEMARKGEVVPPTGAPLKEVLKTFLHQLKNIVLNPTLMLNCVSVAAAAMPVSGLVAFGPKYVENQFQFPASEANLMVGAIAILCAAVGSLIGSLVLFMFKTPQTKGRNAALFVFIMSVAGLPFCAGFFAYCPSIQIAGVNVRNTSGINSLSCVTQCNCNTSQYEPVCGADGFTYASPCNAGCTIRNLTDPDNPVFLDCGCVMGNITQNMSGLQDSSVDMSFEGGSAVPGFCSTSRVERCSLVAVMLTIIGIAILLQYTRTVPILFVSMRCVADEERHLTLGVISVLVRVFGGIPGVPITGAVFDSACLLRHELEEQCGLTGNCLVYDNEALAIRSMILLLVGMSVSSVFALLVWLVYPKKQVVRKKGENDCHAENPAVLETAQ